MLKKWIILIFLFFSHFTNALSKENNIWNYSFGNYESHKFYQNSLINKKNINQLKKISEVELGFKVGDTIQMTPVFTGKNLIVTDLKGNIYSINPQNGSTNWKTSLRYLPGRRGLTYREINNDKLIFVPTTKGIAVLNSKDGSLNKKYGMEGYFGANLSLLPPIIYNNQMFIANLSKGIEAYSINSGKRNWITNLNLNKVEARVWGGFSLDRISKTLFVVTSNKSKFNFNRLLDDYSNSIVAIDIKNGAIKWIFKETKGDVWNLDLVGQPIINNKKNKNNKRSLLVVSKTGNIIVLDIDTGNSLKDKSYKFVNVETSSNPKQYFASTQKKFFYPKPFFSIEYNLKDQKEKLLKKYPNKKKYIKARFLNSKSGYYLPPSLDYDLIIYGAHGGAIWHGASFDESDQTLIIPYNSDPWIYRLYYDDKFHNFLKYRKKILSFMNKNFYKQDNLKWTYYDNLNNAYTKKLSDIEIFFKNTKIFGDNKLYLKKCASCHGIDLRGLSKNNNDGIYVTPIVGRTLIKKRNQLINYKKINDYHDNLDLKYYDKLEDDNEFKSINLYLSNYDNFINFFNLTIPNISLQNFMDQEKKLLSYKSWGGVAAVNLNTGEHLWNKPLGYRLINGKIVSNGDMNFGGSTSVSTGITFVSGATNNIFYAFDTSNGDILWSDNLEYASSSSPMMYKIGGCQYLSVIASGGKFSGYKKNSGAKLINYSLGENCK